MAAAKKQTYLKDYKRLGAEEGWHFLTGPETSSKALADAVGFRYVYDAMTNQYAHSSAIMILTPAGRITRYFYGIDYPSRDVRLGLVEASSERIGKADGPDSAVLLPLRSDYRKVRVGGYERAASGCADYSRRSRHVSDRHVPARLSRRAPAKRDHLMGVFSIFPARASVAAGEVDALYTFLLVVGGVMTALIFFFCLLLRRQVSPKESR